MKKSEYDHLAAQLDADIARMNGLRVEPVSTEPDGVILISGADLTPEPVRWLWPDWLES